MVCPHGAPRYRAKLAPYPSRHPICILETIVPLTELVHYFNKRNRLVRGGEDEGFRFVDGQVRMHFGGRVFGTRFQPIVERAGSQPAGHEAHLNVLGASASPAQTVFLEARDDAELVHLDRMARTLHALNFLLEREQHGGFLALNVHPQLIRAVRDHHGHVFETVLARCGLTSDRVMLELSDDGFEPVAPLATAIAEYRERGYRVAIDNFGRHTSDLERLEQLAPDVVKLDRSLIGHAGHLSLAKRVMTELSAEVRRLGMSVVCQCIENPLQLDVAREAGVDWLQGHLLGRPAAHCLPVPRPRRPRAAA
jgi:EAL domain-containing protein (putative c-di-GMP-specific phosphodiesterase class I)